MEDYSKSSIGNFHASFFVKSHIVMYDAHQLQPMEYIIITMTNLVQPAYIQPLVIRLINPKPSYQWSDHGLRLYIHIVAMVYMLHLHTMLYMYYWKQCHKCCIGNIAWKEWAKDKYKYETEAQVLYTTLLSAIFLIQKKKGSTLTELKNFPGGHVQKHLKLTEEAFNITVCSLDVHWRFS